MKKKIEKRSISSLREKPTPPFAFFSCSPVVARGLAIQICGEPRPFFALLSYPTRLYVRIGSLLYDTRINIYTYIHIHTHIYIWYIYLYHTTVSVHYRYNKYRHSLPRFGVANLLPCSARERPALHFLFDRWDDKKAAKANDTHTHTVVASWHKFYYTTVQLFGMNQSSVNTRAGENGV